MKAFIQQYNFYLRDRRFLFSSIVALLLLAVSLIANFYAGIYAQESASNAVTDIVLSNIRVYNVDDIFVQGFLVLLAFIACLCIAHPKRIPFMVKSSALFVLIRSVFISLTHIAPFPTSIIINSDIIKDFTFGADLFFSGHTGFPFLMALIFWQNIYLRVFFIATSMFFGVAVLLGHLHYSIDVLSAFFITYAIYHIAIQLFVKDKKMFDEGLAE